jgi:Uma2 family endonuclease
VELAHRERVERASLEPQHEPEGTSAADLGARWYDSDVSDPATASIGYDAYLALERESGSKLEYLDGVVRAMAGGSIEHGRLASRFDRLLGAALVDRPCEAFSSDTKVRIDASNRTTYADLAVVCGTLERSAQDPEAIANPVILVEVLSSSTEAYDRGEKFRHYRRLASLREYVLVAQDEPLVEVWRRDGDAWRVHEHGPGEVVRLEACDAEIAVDALYANALG